MKVRAASQIADYLNRLHPESRRQIKRALRALGEGRKADVRPLTDELEGYYRLRVGKFRIIYRMRGDEIFCDFIDVRGTVYERFTSMRELFAESDWRVEDRSRSYGKRQPADEYNSRRRRVAKATARHRAVERAIASFGKHRNLPTHAKLEKSEMRHIRDARAH